MRRAQQIHVAPTYPEWVMRTRSGVEALRERRRKQRFEAIQRNAARRRKLSPQEKLDAATDLIRDAWSLHDAAKKPIVRRRR